MLTYENLSIENAGKIQKDLQKKINLSEFDGLIKTIAGADVSFSKFNTTVHAGIVVMDFPEMTVRHFSVALDETAFPYISGYLAFRELPSLVKAWDMLPEKPDVLILDGQGITHPRQMGIATHFGILEHQPTIGCAQRMLSGKMEDLGLDRMSSAPIIKKGEIAGYALRTKNAVKPIYVSPGNLVSAGQSLEIVSACVGKYRIPEPTRLAHDLVNDFRNGKREEGFYEGGF